ncbi:MAG: FAD-binding protein [Myxococcota bacterium]|nr:FAD-binding protein [Myxococcota bacterium]
MNASLAADLHRLLGPQGFIDDSERCAAYGGDYSAELACPPLAVARPKNSEQAAQLISYLYRVGQPMTLRGAGTGKAGGCVPSEGSIVICSERMNAAPQLSAQDLTLRAPSGLIAAELDRCAAEVGLFYPPDPNSLTISSIGGNVATNAGGPRALKYGLTGHYLLGLTYIGADGALIKAGSRSIKCVAGSNLSGLMLGSEGCFGLITEVTMRLIPRPRCIQTALITFDSSTSAVAAVGNLFACGVLPRTAELLDELSCETIKQSSSHALPASCKAALILETDGSEEQAMDDLVTLARACEQSAKVEVLLAQNSAERERIWAPRRLLSEAFRARRAFKVSEDIAVPRGLLSEALSQLRAAAVQTPFEVATYGHAGDGNLHVNILYDEQHQRPEVEALQDEVFRIAIGLGGTITGEHGVGLAKRHALPWELGAARMNTERALKSAMDPKNLFNPGKVLEP